MLAAAAAREIPPQVVMAAQAAVVMVGLAAQQHLQTARLIEVAVVVADATLHLMVD
jgi:hypothetical protein